MPPQLLDWLAPRTGHFKLESGHHGNLWLDLESLFLHPDELRPSVTDLADRLSRYEVDAVCGPLVGGAFLAQQVAAELGAAFIYAERGMPLEREALYTVKYRIPPGLCQWAAGKKVVILDDVINAGSAVRGTLTALQGCGSIPVAIGSLLVLGSTPSNHFSEFNLPVETLASLPSELWTPSKCPLCAAGMALEDFTETGASG
jgi:orotate phosphoribosyltransferase